MNLKLPSFQSIERSTIAIIVAMAITFLASVPIELWASTIPFNPEPEFTKTKHFTRVIAQDPADIYFPIRLDTNSHRDLLPVALLFQGANVDKSNYSLFANILARYGFIVVVPNHLRKFPPIPGLGQDILLPEQHQIINVLEQMKGENSDISSPLFDSINLDKLVLIGHSMGGLVGLNAIQDRCNPPLCFGSFSRPPALVGGVFYGTNLKGHFRMRIHSIANDGIPTALIQGSLDTESAPKDAEATYQQIQDSPKALFTIVGANHYGITNTNNPVNPPGLAPIQADSIAPTLDQEKTIETVARWSALFLRAHVMSDRGALDYLHRPVTHEYETVLLN